MSILTVLHQGAIGDFLLSMPVIAAVRAQLNATRVVAIASAPSARLAAGRSVVDAWLCPESLGLYRLFCRDLEVDDQLNAALGDATYVLNLMSGPASCVHERLAEMHAGQVVSIDPRPTSRTRESRHHITQQWAADIRAAGWPVADPQPTTINLPRTSHGGGRVLIHPGSGGRAKCWPLERYVAMADTLAGADVTWMLGPAETEQARALQDRGEPILIEQDFIRAAEHMSRCDVYVGNDSGMTHLAAAIGLPTVAIFATTDPKIWRALGDHVHVVAPAEPADTMDAVELPAVHDAAIAAIDRATRQQADPARRVVE